MPRGDRLNEPRLGVANIRDGLAWHRLRQETDKIAGMSSLKHDTDFAVMLHAANSWPVAGPRINHDKGRFWVGFDAFGRENSNQRIVYRALERAAIQH